jgi:hypothetical protein
MTPNVKPIANPVRLWSRSEVLTAPCPVPAVPGVYGWYFREMPHREIDTRRCVTFDGLTLLYVGIAPKPPPANGTVPSKQTLRTRIRYHYRGNAAGSTLRLTLGCLLAEELAIQLRRVGSGGRLTFAGEETALSQWMEENARVCWLADLTPWVLEHHLIGEFDLPLNLQGNSTNPFWPTLTAIRAQAKVKARELPIVN